MSAIAPVADRLGKLLPRLASDHDNEVLATVAAIKRTLEAAGADLHDLTAALTARQVRPTTPNTPPHPDPAARSYPYGSSTWTPPELTETSDWREAARQCLAHLLRFNEREREFIGTMTRKARSHTGKPPSDKQLAWIFVLHDLLMEGRR